MSCPCPHFFTWEDSGGSHPAPLHPQGWPLLSGEGWALLSWGNRCHSSTLLPWPWYEGTKHILPAHWNLLPLSLVRTDQFWLQRILGNVVFPAQNMATTCPSATPIPHLIAVFLSLLTRKRRGYMLGRQGLPCWLLQDWIPGRNWAGNSGSWHWHDWTSPGQQVSGFNRKVPCPLSLLNVECQETIIARQCAFAGAPPVPHLWKQGTVINIKFGWLPLIFIAKSKHKMWSLPNTHWHRRTPFVLLSHPSLYMDACVCVDVWEVYGCVCLCACVGSVFALFCPHFFRKDLVNKLGRREPIDLLLSVYFVCLFFHLYRGIIDK